MTELYPRWQKAAIKQMMFERRVRMLSGPRQIGKTTLASEPESNQLANELMKSIDGA
jgi:predicted AAA+ superfamily ATPase